MRPTIIATVLLAFISLAASAADQGRVENQFFTIRDFALTNGTVMPEVKIAYETYGTLAPNGRNALLIMHGYTSTHHAAGRNPANGDNPGWCDGLIGPGKAIDTDKLFVVSSNALGSSAGSTNGASLNPGTGHRVCGSPAEASESSDARVDSRLISGWSEHGRFSAQSLDHFIGARKDRSRDLDRDLACCRHVDH